MELRMMPPAMGAWILDRALFCGKDRFPVARFQAPSCGRVEAVMASTVSRSVPKVAPNCGSVSTLTTRRKDCEGNFFPDLGSRCCAGHGFGDHPLQLLWVKKRYRQPPTRKDSRVLGRFRGLALR